MWSKKQQQKTIWFRTDGIQANKTGKVLNQNETVTDVKNQQK